MRLGVKVARGKPARLVFDGIDKARPMPIAGLHVTLGNEGFLKDKFGDFEVGIVSLAIRWKVFISKM